MKTKFITKLLSMLLIAFMLLPNVLVVIPVFAEEIVTYVLDVGGMANVTSNTKIEGDTDTCGDDNFFTVHYKAATKIEDNEKSFLGFTATKRIDFQGAVSFDPVTAGCVSFWTQGSATVTVYWGSGDNGRQIAIYDESGKIITKTEEESVKNEIYTSTLTLDKAGTFYLASDSTAGNCYIYGIEVTTKKLDRGPRDDWSNVQTPTFAAVQKNDEGKLVVSVNALVDHQGADYLVINMYQGEDIISTVKVTSIKKLHNIIFSPVESDTYHFEAIISRDGEEDKKSELYEVDYSLPLASPFITLASNLGDGSVDLVWNPTREAESYNVYVNGKFHKNTTDRHIVVSGLTMNKLAKFEVEAVRGTEVTAKSSINVTVGKEKRDWNFTIYGPSTDKSNNVYTENKDGSVTVKSINGRGKIQPSGPDGLAFYYTAIPSDKNFTFRTKVTVNYWTFSNGQDGFGIMAMDHVPSASYSRNDFWSNLYMALASKIEYRYEDIADGEYEIYTTDSVLGDKYSMKLGIGTTSKVGIDQSILDRTTLGEQGLIVGQNGSLECIVQTLECRAGLLGKKPGTYNIIGNCQNAENLEGILDRYLVTELTLEIQKNNTGYFITYYDQDGNVVRTVKNYDPNALSVIDPDYVYIGMFASRNASATFSDIDITISDPENDPPAEPRPIKKITPTVTVTSATSTTTTQYNLVADFNVAGTVDIYMNNRKLASGIKINQVTSTTYDRLNTVLDFTEFARHDDTNSLRIVFTPDKDQELPPYTALASTSAVWHTVEITLYKGAHHRKNIYVSPTGLYNGNGSKEHPYDIYTALRCVVPGQTIILMEGTYKIETGLRIERGINGTEENPIRMIADPEAKTRPVLDFVNKGTGITHGGNWWYFYGFDVTNSLDGYKGFQVSGNNNILDQIHTYYNGNTGIQISRYHVADVSKDQWPANNLILNCTSWGNADSGYEDADGFAAKLTIGDGNVFDGCVAHHNADDGWDLYAKVATGSIGSVIIRNCVAYANGYLENGTIAGNGNGFKMGGDSLSGQHQIINSIAFNNRAKGIDSNSCPDIIVKNCIAYNNESHNVAFYTNSAPSTDYIADGLISIKDNALSDDQLVKDNLKPLGNQDTGKYLKSTNYFWNGTSSKNNANKELTTDIFKSLEFKGIIRNADGTINMQGFLELIPDKVPVGVGTTGDSTPSMTIVLAENEQCTYSEEWTTTDQYVHWHECECGDKADIEEHDFVYIIDVEATDDTPGKKHGECTICGYKRPTIEIPALRPPVDNTMPDFFTDFAGWWAWLFQVIANFFANLFSI